MRREMRISLKEDPANRETLLSRQSFLYQPNEQ